MIHIKAMAIGLVCLTVGAGAVACVVRWPLVGFPILVLVMAYCAGRGALDTYTRS